MKKDTNLINTCFAVANELLVTGRAEIGEILDTENITYRPDFIKHESLYELFSKKNLPSDLLKIADGLKLIATPLLQFLIIDLALSEDIPELLNLKNLRDYIQHQFAYKALFPNWGDRGLFIVFMEYNKLITWCELAIDKENGNAESIMLENSFLYCNVGVEELFQYIRNQSNRNPHPGSLYSIGNELVTKLEIDRSFSNEIWKELPTVFDDDTLRQILPALMKGMTRNDSNWYLDQLPQLIASYGELYLTELLAAMAIACPSNDRCREQIEKELFQNRDSGRLTPEQYLQAIVMGQLTSDSIRADLLKIAELSENAKVLLHIVNYLTLHLEESAQRWFKDISELIVAKPVKELIVMIDHLFLLLTEHDPEWVYELLTLRFKALGKNYFLTMHWYTLVQKDKDLFSAYLTKWFNMGERLVYHALLELCTVRDLDGDDFMLSQESLGHLSERDKIFIGFKIAGYIYPKDELQGLMFSLIESIKPSERFLTQEVFNIMYNYVIYNYRSILEVVKERIKNPATTEFALSFYKALNDNYEIYFESLRQVKDFSELRADRRLADHIQFYTQQKFNEDFKALPEPAWATFGKNVVLHSHRWAVRRASQPVHQVSPLAHIETTAEFPSGERLNPIFQETLRRTYQQKKRDEISFN